jgi:flagellar export protein FliJ
MTRAVNVPGFNFKLERVRAVRERTEQLAKQDLAEAISKRTGTEADLRAAEAQLEQAHVEHRAKITAHPDTLDASELVGRQAYVERVEAQRTNHVQELGQRKAEVAERDAKLAKAAGEHEMLKRLRERQRDEHNREAGRREQGALDEIAATSFERSRT